MDTHPAADLHLWLFFLKPPYPIPFFISVPRQLLHCLMVNVIRISQHPLDVKGERMDMRRGLLMCVCVCVSVCVCECVWCWCRTPQTGVGGCGGCWCRTAHMPVSALEVSVRGGV